MYFVSLEPFTSKPVFTLAVMSKEYVLSYLIPNLELKFNENHLWSSKQFLLVEKFQMNRLHLTSAA